MDDIDEFDDEEIFLNLDDVLQGAAPSQCFSPLVCGQACEHTGKADKCRLGVFMCR